MGAGAGPPRRRGVGTRSRLRERCLLGTHAGCGIGLLFGNARTQPEPGARGPLVAGDATVLPFRDRSFEVVLAAHMLYHVADRELAISELHRVLNPPGICIAVTNGEKNQAELVGLLEDVVGHGWKWQRPSDHAFSLENGASQLATAFDHIRRVDCPPGVVEVTDAQVLADYLNSVADHYQARDIGMDQVGRCRAGMRRQGS